MRGLAGQVAVALLPVALVGVVALLIWRKLFGASTAAEVLSNTVDAAVTIPSGLVSLVGSAVSGDLSNTYITAAQQRELAAQQLAKHMGGGGNGG